MATKKVLLTLQSKCRRPAAVAADRPNKCKPKKISFGFSFTPFLRAW